MNRVIKSVVRRLDYTVSEEDLNDNVEAYLYEIKNKNYDFSNYNREVFTQGKKKRIIYKYDKMSVENVLCHYLKRKLDNIFNIKYASRSKTINQFINTLPVVKDLNDFVIIRADFKSFFDSVMTKHIFEKYIKESLLQRKDKEILEEFIIQFKYCYAGLCLSNGMTEIICRDFDEKVKAKFDKYGVVFYERYVDDIMIIFNSFITKDQFLILIKEVIVDVFDECPIKLNLKQDKFSYISKRDLQPTQKFDFLGYSFTIDYSNSNFKFIYGIAEKKRKRYTSIIENAFIDYKKNNNLELLRQRIKMYSSRVVIARSLGNNKFEWLTRGVVANYIELRFHMNSLESDTVKFLKSTYMKLITMHKLQCPYFLNNSINESSIYNLYSSMKRNRSIIFESSIGVKRKDVVKWIRKIEPTYNDTNKSYYQIVMEYFEILKIE